MFNFPDAPTEGQLFNPPGGPQYKYNAPVWKAFYPDADVPAAVPEAPSDGQVYGRLNATWVILASGTGDATPPGTVIWSARTTPPVGYLKANGASLLRADYPALFSAIGTTYGAADGTHFTLPDLRGEFVRGFDDGRGIDAGRVQGAAQAAQVESHSHAFTGTAMPTHNHTASSGTESADHTHATTSTGTAASAGSHSHNIDTAFGGSGGASIQHTVQTAAVNHSTDAAGAHTHSVTVSGTSGGRSAAHTHAITVVAVSAGTPAGTNAPYGSGAETRSRNVALLACIKF